MLAYKTKTEMNNYRLYMSTIKQTSYVICRFALSYRSMYRRSDGVAILLCHHKTLNQKSSSPKKTQRNRHLDVELSKK